ncbi:MAG TPA: DUF1990 domain-containing protein [Acidimicrobiales bacterium]|nr:DUF1990 domain-containing protein [Acidimicrobiales bacterium]
MLVLRRPATTDLQRLAAEQRDAPLTYAAVGATLAGRPPEGYRFEEVERCIGSDFSRARGALANWQPHRGAGIAHWADGDVAPGTTVALAAPLPVGYAVAACRIVAVVDDADRFGFAYGTLPVHPESGEELFTVEQRGDGVWFRIAVFWRPQELLARIGYPVARILQSRATSRYLDAMAQG